MRRPVDYNSIQEMTPSNPWAAPFLLALVWIGGLFRQFFNWIWQRLKSIFVEYPVTKKDVADIKLDMADIKTRLATIEERQFSDQKTIGRIETFLEQAIPLYNKINAYFAKHNE